jgi:3-hydroxy-9,10-secoandrosta-1,3,5(10)-triene-9,17-dione monooxygenase reductase component
VSEHSHPEIDAAAYRHVMGHFPSGVTIITAVDPDDSEPVGLAASSFTSVSMDPPLVLFCAGSHSSSWPRIKRAGSYCVNIVGADHEWISRQFSSKVPDKFADVTWRTEATGAPVLDDAHAWIDCVIHEQVAAGDHVIVVGRVIALGAAEAGGPLAYYRGGYGAFSPAAPKN